MTTTEAKVQKLTAEKRRLAARLAEAEDILSALRRGEVDALISSGMDAVYAVQLIALGVDKAETYLESLQLLLNRVCHATGWAYGEAYAASENRRSLQRTQVWCGVTPDAVRLHERIACSSSERFPDEAMLQAMRSGQPQRIRIEDLRHGDYRDALASSGIQRGLALPLVVGGQITALFALWRRDGYSNAVVQQAIKILEHAAPFVQRKRDDETRRTTLDALKGMVHERSRRLAELSGQLEQQSARREHAEALSRDHQEASRKSKQAMEKQGALLQSVLDAMAEGVIVTDSAGRALQFNPAARELLGDPPGDVPLEKWPELYGLHRASTVVPLAGSDFPIAKASRGERAERMEIFVKSDARPAGRTIAMSARPLMDWDGSTYGAVAVFQDVTKEKRDEARRIRRIMEQRDVLVREVHHRIKNNLAGVVALLQHHVGSHPEMKDLIAQVEAQLYTVASMHGLEAVRNDGILLGSLIRNVSENTQSLFGKAVNVDFAEKSDHVWSLRLRETESVPLALALNELMVNAHKHGKDAPLQIRAMPDGKGAIIEIANEVDSGARVPDLRAVSENGGGLGLVLALLPQEHADLEFERSGSRMSAIVRLRPGVFVANSPHSPPR